MSRQVAQIIFYLVVGIPLAIVSMWLLKVVPVLGENSYFSTLGAIVIAVPVAHWMREKVFGPPQSGTGR